MQSIVDISGVLSSINYALPLFGAVRVCLEGLLLALGRAKSLV